MYPILYYVLLYQRRCHVRQFSSSRYRTHHFLRGGCVFRYCGIWVTIAFWHFHFPGPVLGCGLANTSDLDQIWTFHTLPNIWTKPLRHVSIVCNISWGNILTERYDMVRSGSTVRNLLTVTYDSELGHDFQPSLPRYGRILTYFWTSFLNSAGK